MWFLRILRFLLDSVKPEPVHLVTEWRFIVEKNWNCVTSWNRFATEMSFDNVRKIFGRSLDCNIDSNQLKIILYGNASSRKHTLVVICICVNEEDSRYLSCFPCLWLEQNEMSTLSPFSIGSILGLLACWPNILSE